MVGIHGPAWPATHHPAGKYRPEKMRRRTIP